MATIWLAHIEYYDPAVPGVATLYLSSQGYTTQAAGYPASGAAHTAYDPRIKQPAIMRRDCFDAGTTGGASRVGYGALELVNVDGGLDWLADVGLDGRAIEILLGVVGPGDGGTPTWTTVLLGTMEQPEIGWDRVVIRLRDRQAELDKPLSANTYGGTNSLPAGLDGVAGDLKGRRRPLTYGKVYNVPPPCVNTARLIYEVGVCNSVDAVYDRGAALTAGAAYTSQADMETNAPAAGTYRAWPAGGYLRLGSSPAGQITADVTQGAAAANRTAAQLAYAIVTSHGGVPSGDVVAADITALDTANSAEVGLWSDADMSCRDALDQVCGAVGAWWGFDRLGRFRAARLEAPSGTPVADLTAADIIRIDRVATGDQGRGVPAWKVRLGYKRIWTVQDADLAAGVTDARRAELRQEWRAVEASDSSIQTTHLLSPELAYETLLVDATAAATEATRRLNLYKAGYARYEARIALDSTLAAALDLGAVVRLTLSRFGMGSGQLLRVIGLRPDLRLNLLDVTLWG